MLSHHPSSQKLAMGLAALAGFVDALGFLSLNGLFVSFMSGNSTRFAVGVAEGIPLHIALLPLGIIGLFVMGVMAGRVIRHFSVKKPSSSILVFMLALLVCAGVLQELHATMPALVLMIVAMGAANNVFFRGGEVSVGVTYMTGTLVKFGQRLAGRLLGEKDQNFLPYLLLWMGLVAGAVLGAAGHAAFGLHILWAGVALLAVLTWAGLRVEAKDL